MSTVISTASVNRNSGRELQASTCDSIIETLIKAAKHQEPLIASLTAAVDSGDVSTILQAAENLAAHRRNEPLALAGKFEETPEEDAEKVDPKKGYKKSAGKVQEKSQEDSSNKDGAAQAEVEPVQKEKTVSKSIRLWESAFAALKVLMGKYGMNMVDMASIAIIAYAKHAAAAAIVRFRILDDKTLFVLQASASDIRAGLSNLRNDLYEARKSHRDPEERKSLYSEISAKYQKVLVHADETLTLMDEECLLHDLLEPSDHALLIQAVERLERAEPKTRTETQMCDLYLKIFKTLLQ